MVNKNDRLDWMIFEDSIELSSGLMSGCWDKNIFGGMPNIVIAKNFFLPPHLPS